MVKMREANYCNLKLFLIFLVVYGHWIELSIHDNEILMLQYRIIYSFHMPVFVFLTGLFLRREADCIRQLKRLAPIYLICQTGVMLCGVDPREPYWILWYLFSTCIWATLGAVWFHLDRKRLAWVLLPLSVLAGAVAGYLPFLNRMWSGSRTVVFFPYFFAGLLCDPHTQWRKYRTFGIMAGVTALGGIWLLGDKVSVTFLYHASGYGDTKHGFLLRLLCYGIGMLVGFFLLTWIPGRRFPFTKVGVDTLPVYLGHAPIVAVARLVPTPWGCCVGLSAGLIYVIYRIAQWRGSLHGIISRSGRERRVRISRNL